MKRLIKSFNISENTIDEILTKIYRKYNSNRLYLDFIDLTCRGGTINIDSKDDMLDYYYGWKGDLDEEDFDEDDFNEWLKDSINYGYFSLLDRDWLKLYLSDKSKEDIRKEFPILYKIINGIEENEDDEEFLKECEDSGNFNEYQIRQIKLGLNVLSIEEVKIYANENFNFHQMSEIREGFIDNYFSIEEVKIFARPDFSWEQMRLIREKSQELKEKNKIDKLLEINTSDFNYYQLKQVILGIEMDLPMEKIKEYANPNLSANEMEEKRFELIKEYFSNSDNFKEEEENFENDE